MSDEHRSLREIETDIARNRADLELGLSALQNRLSVDGLIGSAKTALSGNVAEVSTVMSTAVRANPVALALTGLGLIWLMSGRGLPRRPVATAAPAARPRTMPDIATHAPPFMPAADPPIPRDRLPSWLRSAPHFAPHTGPRPAPYKSPRPSWADDTEQLS